MNYRKTCVHCQDYPACRNTPEEPYYGVLSCGCTACDCHKTPEKSGFTCAKCGKFYSSWKKMVEHLDSEHKIEWYAEDAWYTWGI